MRHTVNKRRGGSRIEVHHTDEEQQDSNRTYGDAEAFSRCHEIPLWFGCLRSEHRVPSYRA
jgi:hypothetical protein